jgi:hypothetical protein
MMTCSPNLSKHLKGCCQTKINREMLEHNFQFSTNLMIFFSKKNQILHSHIYFSHLCKSSNSKKLIITSVFEYFQSHWHISRTLHEFLDMMGSITIFFKIHFLFCGFSHIIRKPSFVPLNSSIQIQF